MRSSYLYSPGQSDNQIFSQSSHPSFGQSSRLSLYIRLTAIACILLLNSLSVCSQQSIGIGTTTPDNHAALDITSTTKGVLPPRLTPAQITTLAGSLTTAETGMQVANASTGALEYWNGSAWQTYSTGTPPTALSPFSITANTLSLNPGTAAGDLLTWDGTNWINAQPAIQHFSFQVDNHQPYLAVNYCIAMFGIFPTQNDATEPYVGEIFIMGCNFAPVGFNQCNGALLSIAVNTVLFDLIGTTYGGDGITTFALPDLRGRIAIHQGNNGTSTYVIGQNGGLETKTFAQ
jgi:microcystin-dependent protein